MKYAMLSLKYTWSSVKIEEISWFIRTLVSTTEERELLVVPYKEIAAKNTDERVYSEYCCKSREKMV
jgi:hypothetical protein